MVRKSFRPDLDAVVGAASNIDPSQMVLAVMKELEPPVDAAVSSGAAVDRDALLWILMELVLNAVNARIGSRLEEMTGLARNRLLAAFGVNILYPDGSEDSIYYGGGDARALSAVTGMPVRCFVKLSLADKFRVLGLDTSRGWVTLEVFHADTGNGFAVRVSSDYRLSGEDEEEILRRFREPDRARREISLARKTWEDGKGIFRMPSFTGGGGFGLLECLRVAREEGLGLDYVPGQRDGRRAVFEVSYEGSAEIRR